MTAYWSQFSKSELDSMQGIESSDDTNLDQIDIHSHIHQDEQLSFETLGMSWRDFV